MTDPLVVVVACCCVDEDGAVASVASVGMFDVDPGPDSVVSGSAVVVPVEKAVDASPDPDSAGVVSVVDVAVDVVVVDGTTFDVVARLVVVAAREVVEADEDSSQVHESSAVRYMHVQHAEQTWPLFSQSAPWPWPAAKEAIATIAV